MNSDAIQLKVLYNATTCKVKKIIFASADSPVYYDCCFKNDECLIII